MTAILYLTRGIPGSGKTTWRQRFQERRPATQGISRDDLRDGMFGRFNCSQDEENQITKRIKKLVRGVLQSGVDIIVDNQSLRDREVKEWVQLAGAVGAEVSVQDFRGVPLDTCLERVRLRNEKGERQVPEEYVSKQYERFIRGKKDVAHGRSHSTTHIAPETPEWAPVAQDESLPRAFIFDVDGTLADHNGRNPYDAGKAVDDLVYKHVRDVLKAVSRGHGVIICTGRNAEHRDVTENWLLRHRLPFDELHTRQPGDTRDDAIVKSEMLDDIVKHHNVMGVFDDRPRVSRMWRARGIPTFQVGDPDVEF